VISCKNCGTDLDRLYVKHKNKSWGTIGYICMTCGAVYLPKGYAIAGECA